MGDELNAMRLAWLNKRYRLKDKLDYSRGSGNSGLIVTVEYADRAWNVATEFTKFEFTEFEEKDLTRYVSDTATPETIGERRFGITDIHYDSAHRSVKRIADLVDIWMLGIEE